MSSKGQFSDNPVVDLAHARVRLRSRAGKPTPEFLAGELEAINLLLDQGHSVEARSRLTSLISGATNNPVTLAMARLALSLAMEMHGERRESLQAVAMYELPEARAKLPANLAVKILVQISIAYNYSGDHPKAITLLKAMLRDLPVESADAGAGDIYAALGRVYRSINEYQIGLDYSQRALEIYRQSGNWRGLAEAYFGIALSIHAEGQHESALENFGQALQLIGDHPSTFLLGKIYSNMAGACCWLKRPLEGIRYLEKAIGYYERTEHKNLAADAHNNLGMNLILVGQWDRAQEALERALALATEVDDRADRVSMILDSLAELSMLRGNLDEAKSYLERAVELSFENDNKWYTCQVLRTLARWHILMNASTEASATAKQAFEMAEHIRDRTAVCESELLLAESYLKSGKLELCDASLRKVSEQTSDSAADIGLVGETQRLRGLLALNRSDGSLAVQHFGRTVSIFEMLGDRYRSGRAHYELGRAYMLAQPQRATEHLSIATSIFRELGACLDLASAEAALAMHSQTPLQRERQSEAVLQLVTLRLAEAVASRPLLLRELAAVIRQETAAQRVMIFEPDEEQRQTVVIAHGYNNKETSAIADEFTSIDNDAAFERFAKRHDAKIITLKSTNALPATLLISPRDCAHLSEGLTLEPLLRLVELAMDVCALRARAAKGKSVENEGAVGASLMPGFIHSSQAMTRLVEEVHKIRSSDVTVLVTGESGTGKELVARAIHALSARRDKVFVPFNCTAVPKELSESYLFGYRRGAFTGAVSDSLGLIRTAAGGTLFLDEVGDLPLDLQPKLLRFLQEGEIQPLGERQPLQIDVRIIAATNTDLEESVAQGRFREDLYYRLNIIRLRVPPLRERRSEIPAIVNYYINHYAAKFGRYDIHISPQAVDLLMVAGWPGNVRQLCNEIQRIVARAENNTLITPEHLSPELRRIGVPSAPPAPVARLGATNGSRSETISLEGVTLADALAEVERRMIGETLRKHKGNISRAARELGLTRRGLYLKIERYEIKASA